MMAQSLKKLEFEDGDRIIIAQQTSDRKDYVEVKGAVNYPGIYGIKDYNNLKSLLEKVDLQEETRRDVGYLLRIAPKWRFFCDLFQPAECP